MLSVKNIFLKGFDFLIRANFAVALILLVSIAFLALTNNEILFEDSEDFTDLYGPLVNNLRLILVYIGVAEVNIFFYCWYKKKQHFLLAMGIFYLSLIGGFELYGKINQIPIDPRYDSLFFYQGVSHILFGGSYLISLRYRKKSW